MRLSVLLPASGRFFLFQQRIHPTPGLIGPTGGGILDSVASVIACLPALGSLPELAPQVFRSVIQATADKLFWRRFEIKIRNITASNRKTLMNMWLCRMNRFSPVLLPAPFCDVPNQF